ncbi:MAG: NADP-dependent phosphogluconate dehydrogenase [Trueperella sp.]|nr:NADP-dependent phosphogluconate dehydrogenase [Trueperella sp.]
MKADIGVVGTGVMGASLARNLARHGHKVAIYDLDPEKARRLATAYESEGTLLPAADITDFVAKLDTPRVALLLVPAGAPTDAAIDQLAAEFTPGDIVVDMGNSFYQDTRRREAALREKGLHFVGCGTSGGEEGALLGPSLMPGGSPASYDRLGPMFESIAAHADDGAPCCTYIGPDGAGHYVKMVHNGIEYADMQLIAEAYQVMRHGLGMTPAEISAVFRDWNTTELNSYLIEVTAEVLAQVDAETDKPFIDIISDVAGQKGTGAWTVQDALTLATPVTVISEATMARGVSAAAAARKLAAATFAAPTKEITGAAQSEFVESLRQALFAAKVISYTQGFMQLQAASAEYDWNLDFSALARIWRAGCIIRAQFLDQISDAYQAQPDLELLAADDYFADALRNAEQPWRQVVTAAIGAGIPVPALAAALNFFDAIRTDRLPTAVVQGQRDFFGAHTYRRIDRDGVFHTLWSADRSEQQVNH